MADKEEEKSEWEEILVPLDGLDLEEENKENRDYGIDEILVPLNDWDDPKIDPEEYKRLKEERDRLLREKEKQKRTGVFVKSLIIALLVAFGIVSYKLYDKSMNSEKRENVATTTAQADNSASLKAQLEAEKTAREESERKQREAEASKTEEERKRQEAEEKATAEAATREESETAVQQLATTTSSTVRQYKVGDIITFGSYPFYADGRRKAVDWVILDIDVNGNALVISDYALDNVKYNEKYGAITWEKSTIRKWLNERFINKAFTVEQRSKIIESRIENNDNAECKTIGGNDTYDKLFLLSIDESNKYFKNKKSRIAYPTPYAKSSRSVNGKLHESSYVNVSTDRGGSCEWWLRSPGGYQQEGAFVTADGLTHHRGRVVDNDSYAVRPAFKINLKNLDDAADIRQSTASKYQVGNYVEFGSYPYEADGTVRPIEWLVLASDGSKALLITRNVIDGVPYHKTYESITWEKSTIRKWLNERFINKVFTVEQRSKIKESYLEKNDNAEYGTKGGNDTYDKLFLLSIEEVNRYFDSDNHRKAYPTPYANLKTKESTTSSWWLRSPGDKLNLAAYVTYDGRLNSSGTFVDNKSVAVRTALWLDIKNP